MRWMQAVLILVSATVMAACGGGDDEGRSTPAVVVLFGDSLTENRGEFVTPSQHFETRLRGKISAEGLDRNAPITVVNEGIGGETTVGALRRLPNVLAAHRPTHVVIQHGTNDIWTRCGPCFNETRANLEQLAVIAKNAGAQVVFAETTFRLRGGGEAAAYTDMVQRAAQNTGSTYVNLVANVPYDGAHYSDGIHFTDLAQEAMASSLAGGLFPLLR